MALKFFSSFTLYVISSYPYYVNSLLALLVHIIEWRRVVWTEGDENHMKWLVATSLHTTIPKRQEDYLNSSTCKVKCRKICEKVVYQVE